MSIMIEVNRYKQIYKKKLEDWKKHDKTAPEKQFYHSFLTQIKKQLKIEIVFDADIIPVLIETIQSAKTMKSVDYLHQHLSHVQGFTQFLLKRKFIQRQHKDIIKKYISKQRENNEDLVIYTLSRYLASCGSKQQFQTEWAEKSPFLDYNLFWQNYLDHPRQSIKTTLNKIYECFQKQGINSSIETNIVGQLQNYLSTIKGNNPEEVEINQMLEKMIDYKLLRDGSAQMRRFDEEYNKIKDIICEFAHTIGDRQQIQLKMAKFGSLCNGFASEDADLDITILTNCFVDEKKIIDHISNYMNFKLNEEYIVRPLPGASTPIIQVIKKTDRNSNSKQQKIDIAINNICGIVNSRFLKTYSDMHTGIKTMGVLLKLWGKKHDLISPLKMSSYSFILMMLYYLIKQNVVPNILENLKGTEREDECIKIKRFKKDEKQEFLIYNVFKPKQKKLLRFNVYQHLLGFMRFYQEGGKYFQEGHAVSLDLSEKALDPQKIFTIKDPFDQPHNPGRWTNERKPEMMRQIKNAIRQLQSMKKESIKSLFI